MQKVVGTAALSAALLAGLGWLAFGLATVNVAPVVLGWLAPKSVVLFSATAGISAVALVALMRGSPVLLPLAIAALAFVACGPAAVFATVALAWAGYLVGDLAHPGGPDSTDGPRRLFFRIAIGLLIIAIAMNVVIALPINGLHFYGAAALALAAARPKGNVRFARELVAVWRSLRERRSVWELAIWVAIAVIVAIQLAHASFPERQHDSLAFHLLVAETVKENGQWHYAADFLVGAVQPLGADLLNSIAYVVAGESGARLANYSYVLIGASLLYSVVLSFGRLPAVLATLLVLSCPIAFLEADGIYADNFLLLAFTAALGLIAFWPDLPARDRILCAAAVLGGLPTAKLHGVIVSAVVFVALLAKRAWRDIAAAGWKVVLVALSLLLLGAAPYLIAFYVTGNPMFPFFNGLFKSPFFDSNNNFSPPFSPKFGLAAVHDLSFHTSKHFQGADGTFGFQVAAFLLASITAVVVRRRFLPIAALAIFAVYFLVVTSQTADARYFYPSMPALSVGIAFFIGLLGEVSNRLVTALAMISATAVSALNVVYYPGAGWMLPMFNPAALVDESQREQMILEAVPQRKLVELVNASEGKHGRILYIGQPVGFPLEGEPIFSNWYMASVFERMVALKTDEEVSSWLASLGATHIIIPTQGEQVWNDAVIRSYLSKHAEPIEVLGSQALYKVPDSVVFHTVLVQPEDWKNWSLDGASLVDGNVNLAPTKFIWFGSPQLDSNQKRVRISLRGGCDTDTGQVNIQTNWTIRDSTAPKVVSKALPCANGPDDQVAAIFDRPPNAVSVVVYIIRSGDSPATIDNVSITATAATRTDPVPLYRRPWSRSPAWSTLRRLLPSDG